MRQWDIEVTQYTRGSLNKAPDGCLQYHYGDKTGYLETFNYAEGVHLAYQNQLICIRREENMCKICYTQVAATDFQISGGGGLSAGFVDNSGACGGEGSARDLIIIPSPIKSTANEDLVGDGKFCGAVFVTATGATPATVCSKLIVCHLFPFCHIFLLQLNQLHSNSASYLTVENNLLEALSRISEAAPDSRSTLSKILAEG